MKNWQVLTNKTFILLYFSPPVKMKIIVTFFYSRNFSQWVYPNFIHKKRTYALSKLSLLHGEKKPALKQIESGGGTREPRDGVGMRPAEEENCSPDCNESVSTRQTAKVWSDRSLPELVIVKVFHSQQVGRLIHIFFFLTDCVCLCWVKKVFFFSIWSASGFASIILSR